MPLEIGAMMPPLEGATEWLNATGARAEHEAQGHVTLVHFWSVSCGVCRENLPRLTQLRDARASQGLRVIAVHAPTQEDDADAEAVRDAVAQWHVAEPCAIDNERKLSEAFGNEQGRVPAYYLFDAEGKLRTFAAGAGGLQTVVAALEELLPKSEE